MDSISIIVPVYNVEQYLCKCIDSILMQTFKHLQIILVDDGSEDLSGKICDKYEQKDKRIKVIHKQNGGLSDARNCGLDNASGEYVIFVDSDDYIEKDACAKLIEIASKYKVDIVTGEARVIQNHKKMTLKNYDTKEIVYLGAVYLKKQLQKKFISGISMYQSI